MKNCSFCMAMVLSFAQLACAADLTVSGDTAVDPSVAYDAVTVTADATISGTLTLTNRAKIVVQAGTANFIGTVRFDATNTVTIAPASGATANFTGKLTGSADIDVNGPGKTYFTSDTSDFDGNLTITTGEFHAKGTKPFGSTNGYTYFKGTDDLTRVICFDGVTTSEDLRISAGVNKWGNKNVLFTANCTFNGPFTATASIWEWWVFSSGITVTFNGAMSGYGSLMGDDYGGNPRVVFNCPAGMGTMYWKNGTLDFNRPLTLSQRGDRENFHIRGGTTYNLNCANVFGNATYSSRIQWENADVASATLNIVSNDQYFAYFYNGGWSARTTFTSQNAVTLHLSSGSGYVVGSGQEFRGLFTGRLGLSVEGGFPLALYGANTTLGTLALANGAKVTLASGSKWVGGISLAHSDGSETLTLNGGDLSVPDLWIGGVRVAGGTYGSSSSTAQHKLACFAGTGVITVPNARLLITGDYEVPAEGVTCSGVTVTGAARVTGGMITVEGDGLLEINADATFECPVCLGATATNAVRFMADAGVAATFAGPISGFSNIEIAAYDATGSVTFSGANTFDGNLVVTRGAFHAVGDGAFGSTNGYTTMTSGTTLDRKIYFDGFTTSEDIRISQGGGWGIDSVFFTEDCTFNGPVSGTKLVSEWWSFTPGKRIVFNGPFTGFHGIMGGDRGGSADVTWTGPVSFKTHYWQWGSVTHYTPITFTQCNDRDNLRVRGGCTYNLYCADVFGDATYATRMQWEAETAKTRTTIFNVVSNDQHFAFFVNGGWSDGTRFTSQTPGVMIHLESGRGYTGVPSYQQFNGIFAGTVGLSVEGPLPLTLGGASTTSGTLALTNGAQVTFTAGGAWVGPVSLANGDGTAEKLTLSTTLAVEALYTNGVRLATGRYGAPGSDAPNTLPCLAGSGSIYVQPSMLVVDADYVVAAGGETYSGVLVNGAATISGGRLTLCGSAPITVRANATFACDVDLDSTACTIAPATNVTVQFDGAISGTAPITIAGEHLSGTVWFHGANTFDGNLLIEKGTFHAVGNGAFGSTNGFTRLKGQGVAATQDLYNRMYIHNACTEENFELSHGFGQAWYAPNVLYFEGSNVINGTVKAAAQVVEFGWVFQAGSVTVFNGPLSGFSGLFGQADTAGWNNPTNATVVFNAPVSMSSAWYGSLIAYDYNARVSCDCFKPRGGTHNLNIPDVFGTGRGLNFEYNRRMRMNLVGGDQHFAALMTGGNSLYADITSANAHTLHLSAAAATDYRGIFSGDVSVSVEGTSATVFAGASTSVGTLTATNGANVTFAAGAKWIGDVRIARGSRITLQGAALAEKKDIQIQGDGQIFAESGVVQKTGLVFVDGRRIPGGSYSANSGPERYRAHFPGAGFVRVAGEGTLLLFR